MEEARSSQSSVVKDLVSKEIQKGAEKLKSMKSIFEKKIKGIEVANKKVMKESEEKHSQELAKYKDELLEAKKNFDGNSLELSSMKEKFESLKKKSDEDWKRMKEEFASKESQKDADYQSELNKVRSEIVS